MIHHFTSWINSTEEWDFWQIFLLQICFDAQLYVDKSYHERWAHAIANIRNGIVQIEKLCEAFGKNDVVNVRCWFYYSWAFIKCIKYAETICMFEKQQQLVAWRTVNFRDRKNFARNSTLSTSLPIRWWDASVTLYIEQNIFQLERVTCHIANTQQWRLIGPYLRMKSTYCHSIVSTGW